MLDQAILSDLFVNMDVMGILLDNKCISEFLFSRLIILEITHNYNSLWNFFLA